MVQGHPNGTARRRSRLALVALVALALAQSPAGPAVAAEDAPPVVPGSVLVGGFESDAEGWGVFPQAGAVSGSYQRVDSGDTSGGMSGEVTVDLSGIGDAVPGGYVELARNLPSLDLTGLTFSVRSSQLTSIAIRFTDSTGQAFQHYRDLVPAEPGWQTFTVDDPAVGATLHFGGDNDGVWHGPASKVAFLVDSGQLVDNTQPASYLLDAVQAHVPPAPPAPPAPSTIIGDFEGESEGWAAFANLGATSVSFQTVASDFVTGSHAAQVNFNLSAPGYAEFTRPLPGVDIDDLTFSVKSSQIQFISARLRDSTGQYFQHVFAVDTAATGWQSFTITDLAAANQGHWDGANDGVWHGPATAIAFNVDSVVDPTQPASYLLDAVTATLVPADLALTTTTLGNVFTVGDAVSVGVETNTENLSWSVKNATGGVVLTGSGTAASLGGEIPLALTTPGWYQLDVTATGPGAAAFTASTTLAVLEDFDRAALKDTRFGVATHFGQDWDPVIVPLIEQAGFGSVRDEAYWDQQETVQGTVTPTPKVLAYESALNAEDVNLLLVLSYGNPFYEDNKAPVTEAGIAAYANYAKEMVEHFGADDTNYEVWNEFNIQFGAGPAGSRPDAYFNLLKESYETIKATNPDAEVIGPVTAGVPMEWLREFFALGGLDYIDALSVHPYTYPAGPESLDETIAELRAVMAEYGTVKPIVISEVGWPTGIAARSIDDITQAQYLVQSQTIALANDVQQYFIYDFMDKGTDPTDTEHRFGLIHNWADSQGAYTPKPSYVSIATSQRLLAGKEAAAEQPVLTGGVRDYAFGSGTGDPTHVLWSGVPQSVSYSTPGAVTVTDLFGASTTLQPDQNGRVTVTAGKSPIYLEGPITAVANGGTYALTVEPGFVGQDIVGHWTIDNSAGSSALDASLEIEGQTVTATVPPGESEVVDLVLPGLTTPGSRSYTGVVLEGTEVVAQLSATVEVSEAVTFTAFRAIAEGADVLRLQVSNASTTPQTVSGATWDIGGVTGSALAGAIVPAGGSVTHDIALSEITAATPYTAQVTIDGGPVLQASGTLHPIGPITKAANKTLVVDGVLDSGLDPSTRIDFGQTEAPELPGWAGPTDLSGQFWFTWDDEFLYVSADVLDNVHWQTATGGNIWQGDSVQIAVGTGAPGDATVWNELGIALTPEGPQSHQWFQAFDASAPQIDVAITRDDATDHTVYEAAIPWSRVAPAIPDGRLVSIGAVVNDSDGGDRRGWISWGGGIAGEKASKFFNAVQLVDADVVTATVDPATPNGTNGWYTTPVTVTLASANGNPIQQRITTPDSPDGTWVDYDGPIQLTDDGDYTIGYRLAGDTAATTSLQVRLDSTAPQVSATVDGDASTVTLTATDANAEGLSVEYSVDGGLTWLSYTEPVTLAEGQVLQYRATDAAGNSAVGTVHPIEVVEAPEIGGAAKVGKTLKTSGGVWGVSSPVLSYQWNRDGEPIEGANATTYKVVAADAGARITVTVTASKDGYTDTTSTSAPRMVKSKAVKWE
jgi:hypothetical protein